MLMCIIFFFFFKQKTAYEMRISDWSSDVCSSDLDEDEFMLRGDRDRRKRAAKREAAGVAHEDGGGGGIEPQESEAGADDRGGEHRQLPRAGDVRDAAIAREFRVSRAVADDEEGQTGDDHREGREPAEPVGGRSEER